MSDDDPDLRRVHELPFSGPAQPRADAEEALADLRRGFEVESRAGTVVRFGNILLSHLKRARDALPEDQRVRFLPAARLAAERPAEVWERGLRRYYIARFSGAKSGRAGFAVVTARKGESFDEVITYFPKTDRELEKFRKGSLIYSTK